MEYPKVTYSYIKIPILIGGKLWRKHVSKEDKKKKNYPNGRWISVIVYDSKKLVPASHTEFKKEKHCQVCCSAHNQRVGFSEIEVEIIIDKLYGKKDKKSKKAKAEKSKKGKRKIKFKKSK